MRCFGPRQRLDLSDSQGRPARWTVILGNNGVGKTTLLRALAAAVLVPNAVPDAHLAPLALEEGRLFRRLLRRTQAPVELSARLALCDHITSPAPAMVEMRQSIDPGGAGEFDLTKELTAFAGMACFAYGAARRIGRKGGGDQEQEANLLDSVRTLIDEESDLGDPEEWLLGLDYAAVRADSSALRQRSARYREEVHRLLIDLLPDISDLRFASKQEGQKSFKPQVEVKTPYGWVRLSRLSWGYRTLVSWLVDLLHRLSETYPKSKNPLAEPAVVLIDEIDLHLHPKWQRTIIQYLTDRLPNTQFIVTAHSPLVVQSAPKANLVVLRQREGADHVEIDNDSTSVRGWRVDQILTSDLYGLSSARAPDIEALLDEQRRLVTKARRTSAERTRLEKITAELASLPTAERPEDQAALDLIREVAAAVRSKRS
jgi:energy-coupling factor transporter ATP-binding protein EcfA2